MDNNRYPIHRTNLNLALAALVGAVSLPAQAQMMLEEVTVTAQKRIESVQDIPLTVAVVNGTTLKEFSINNATDLASYVPGLEMSPAPQGLSVPKIRGLGTGVGAENMEQSIGLFVDGVWAGKPRDLQAALFDVDRIEVIKGSQTSQLGKNTSLGAILVMSNRPDDETGGQVEGEYDFELGSTIFSGVGNLATDFGNYRLAVNLVEEEGYVDNQLAGGHGPDLEQNSVRLGGSWDVGDRLAIYANYTYDDRKVSGMAFEVSEDPNDWYTGVTGDTDVSLNEKNKTWTSYAADGKNDDKQETHRAVIEVNYELNDQLDFISLSGYNEYDNTRYYDADFSALEWLQQYKDSDFQQFSQEFRVSGTTLNDRLDFVVGTYYMQNRLNNYDETGFLTNPGYLDLPDPAPAGVVAAMGPASGYSSWKQDIETWSVFGNGSFQLADRWRLTLGLRYTDETQDLDNWENVTTQDETFFYLDLGDGNYLGPISQPGLPSSFLELVSPDFYSAKLSNSEDNIDGSVNLQYEFSDTGNVYASWAQGSKSGGFTTSAAPTNAALETEKAQTYELGMKSELLSGELRLNAALFYTKIDDFTSVTFVGDGFQASSIPVESQGFEFESMWVATQSLMVSLAATYADAEDTDTNLKPSGAPEWEASLMVNHNLALESGYEINSNAAVNYRDSLYTQADETYKAPSLTLVDLRVALTPPGGEWELALLARNVFNEQELAFGFALPIYGPEYASIGSLNAPRTVMVQAQYNF